MKGLSQGNVSLVDKTTGESYKGRLKADVTISSANQFKLGSEGEYQLVDNHRVPLKTFSLDSSHATQEVNGMLVKANKNHALGFDSLTFDYQITRK